MSYGDNVASTGSDICNLFVEQFSSVYNTCTTSPSNIRYNTLVTTNILSSMNITKAEVSRALKRLDNRKGAGPDGIPSIFAVKCAR